MKKKLRKYIILPLLAVLWLCGCGKKEETDKAETVPDTAAETESQTEETEEKEQESTQYPVSEADTETIYADREKNQELADFLIATSIKINTMVRYKGQFKYLRSFPFNFIFVFFIFTPFKNPAK